MMSNNHFVNLVCIYIEKISKCLRLKNEEHSRSDRIQSNSLKEAKLFYMRRKQMDEKTFNKLYEVTEDEG